MRLILTIWFLSLCSLSLGFFLSLPRYRIQPLPTPVTSLPSIALSSCSYPHFLTVYSPYSSQRGSSKSKVRLCLSLTQRFPYQLTLNSNSFCLGICSLSPLWPTFHHFVPRSPHCIHLCRLTLPGKHTTHFCLMAFVLPSPPLPDALPQTSILLFVFCSNVSFSEKPSLSSPLAPHPTLEALVFSFILVYISSRCSSPPDTSGLSSYRGAEAPSVLCVRYPQLLKENWQHGGLSWRVNESVNTYTRREVSKSIIYKSDWIKYFSLEKNISFSSLCVPRVIAFLRSFVLCNLWIFFGNGVKLLL